MIISRALLILALALGPGASAHAQSPAPQTPPPPAAKPPAKGLDELLGLPTTKPGTAKPEAEPAPSPPDDETAQDTEETELDRRLTSEQLAEKFDEAVRKMAESARRIERLGDVGLETQRLHDEILRNLDVLIKQSQQQSQSSSSSSSSSSSQDSEAARAQQQQKQRSQGQNQEAGQGENTGQAATPPPLSDVERQTRLDTARAAWGSLPQRVRDSLLEGSSDYFSALYESMTEAYYRKIAEEAKE